jgi:hypothetical protein
MGTRPQKTRNEIEVYADWRMRKNETEFFIVSKRQSFDTNELSNKVPRHYSERPDKCELLRYPRHLSLASALMDVACTFEQ